MHNKAVVRSSNIDVHKVHRVSTGTNNAGMRQETDART